MAFFTHQETDNALMEVFNRLELIAENTENDYESDWNQGLHHSMDMLAVAIRLHRDTVTDTMFPTGSGASATPLYSTRNERRVATKRKRKKVY
jgi:hypothetical protein